MQRNKKIYIMLGILLVISIVTFGVSKYESHKENIKNSEKIILEIDSNDVTSLSWEKGSKSFSFHKDEKWIYDEDADFPVNDDKINDMLGIFKEFRSSFVIEDVKDLGQYGLDNPQGSIHIKAKDKSYSIMLGDYSTMDSQRYVSIGDGNVYLVTTDPMDEFDVILSNLIKHDKIPEYTKINDFSVSGIDDYSVVVEPENNNKSYCKDDIYYVKDSENTKSLDTKKVESYFDTIKNLSLTEYVTYKAIDADFEAYGLKAPSLSATVNYTYEDEDKKEKTSKFSYSIGLSEEAKEKIKSVEETKDQNDIEETDEQLSDVKAYLRIGSSKIIYEIRYDDYTSLIKASYNDLRHSEILPAAFEDIQKLEFTIEGNNYLLTSEKKDDEIVWIYNDKEIGISKMQSALAGLKAETFADIAPSQREEIRFTAYLDNENNPTAEIVLYRHDGATCLATLNGKTIALVPRSDAVDLIEAVNAFALN